MTLLRRTISLLLAEPGRSTTLTVGTHASSNGRDWLARVVGHGETEPGFHAFEVAFVDSTRVDGEWSGARLATPPAPPVVGHLFVGAGPGLPAPEYTHVVRLTQPPKDPDASRHETPAHRVRLPRFFIARYPVTVAQWRAYHAATGAQVAKRSLQGVPNHPVVYVSWHDAVGYCRWLTEALRGRATTEATRPLAARTVPEPLATLLLRGDGKSGPWTVTLPSEVEWEKAARGGSHAWRYPWGDEFDANKVNTSGNTIEGRSAVGCFSAGRSTYGIEELSGNVRVWTRSLWGRDFREPEFPYPYEPGRAREDLGAPDDVLRLERGGVFSLGPGYLRSAYRFRSHPTSRFNRVGFRVVVSPFRS